MGEEILLRKEANVVWAKRIEYENDFSRIRQKALVHVSIARTV